jgi:hypothetical protein
MKTVIVVVATEAKTLEEFSSKPIWRSLEAHSKFNSEQYFDFFIKKNNKEGLSKVYNEFLKNEKCKNSILLFVHDDVELDDMFLVEKLNNSPYIVTGLAGCKQIDLSKPSAWHLMSDRKTHVGEVAHSSNGQVWTSVFGPTNSRALLIDGLFIAVDVEKALEKQIEFDETFEFHHYDLAFCLDCNKKKASVGVLPIRVIHHGLGDSMNTKEWHDSSKLFRDKFKK